MKTQNKTILITGGGSGIGYSIAKAFSGKGNQLILVGRNEEKLKEATAQLADAAYIVADVASEKDVRQLVQQVTSIYGGLDILVNNAGVAKQQSLVDNDSLYNNAVYEININYLSVVRLTDLLLPLLKNSKEAAIVNIQSILSYAPNATLPTYSATKAALHSYSQALRLTLQKTNPQVKVFEVFPPLVDTPLTKDYTASKLSPDEVANDIIDGLENNTYAIRNGSTKNLYQLFLQSPEAALNLLNGIEA